MFMSVKLKLTGNMMAGTRWNLFWQRREEVRRRSCEEAWHGVGWAEGVLELWLKSLLAETEDEIV